LIHHRMWSMHFVPSTAARLSIKTRTSTPKKKLPRYQKPVAGNCIRF
jgi:hypothetical protein